jgi:hypothetical protein
VNILQGQDNNELKDHIKGGNVYHGLFLCSLFPLLIVFIVVLIYYPNPAALFITAFINSISLAGGMITIVNLVIRKDKKCVTTLGMVLILIVSCALNAGASIASFHSSNAETSPTPTPTTESSHTPNPTSITPTEEDVIIFPSILRLLDDIDISGGTFLHPIEIDAKIMSRLETISKQTLLTEIEMLSLSLPEYLRKSLDIFTSSRNPNLGESENGALGLSDMLINVANDSSASLTKKQRANCRFLSVMLALYSLINTDDMNTSPLALKAWNRVWANYEQLMKIEGIPERERIMYLCIAASGAYIRIRKSYDGEIIEGKRASDIMSCRVLYLRLMDITERQNDIDVAREFAIRSRYLTDLAFSEGLSLPGNVMARNDETSRIESFLQRHPTETKGERNIP